MAVNFKENIHYISAENPISNFHFLTTLPDKCPMCSFAISPEYILIYTKSRYTTLLLCGCPRVECKALFFAKYFESSQGINLLSCYPYKKVKKEFPEEVEELSPDFVSIFNQAYHAEQEKLDLISGVAYRKSLEYLIKDYILKMFPEDDSKIKSMPLQQCIQKYIAEPTIKHMAERATWLGNDETHYVRKWENKDLQDLKNLIDLTVYFISMSRKASKYMEEMVR